METLTATYHLFAVKYSWDDNWSLVLFTSDKKDSDEHAQYAYLKPVHVSAELPPEKELLPAIVQSLRASQAKVMAEATLQHTKLEETIQSLLALPDLSRG